MITHYACLKMYEKLSWFIFVAWNISNHLPLAVWPTSALALAWQSQRRWRRLCLWNPQGCLWHPWPPAGMGIPLLIWWSMCRSLSCIGGYGNIPHSTVWLSGIARNLVYTTHLPLSSLSKFAANISNFSTRQSINQLCLSASLCSTS